MRYVATVGTIHHAVDPDGGVELGTVSPNDAIEWLGVVTWRAVAHGFPGQRLVTRLGARVLAIACAALDEDIVDAGDGFDDEEGITSDERTSILEVLRGSGREDLADRCQGPLDRVTRTDRPPPATPTAMLAAPVAGKASGRP